MNDLILMSIQGGRYLEAERLLGEIILSNPSPDAYFMLGTIKTNLLLDKGRSYLEVQFCFNKYLSLSADKSSAEKNIMVFCIGLYSQLSELEKSLYQQLKSEKINVATGVFTTFVASKVIDNSKSSFGTISGLVGVGFGVGISLSSLTNIGSLNDIIPYVSKLKLDMIEYLKNTIQIEINLLNNEVLTLEKKYGGISVIDSSTDLSLLKSLGSLYVTATEVISKVKSGAGGGAWQTGLFNKPFELPTDEAVLCGLTSTKDLELLFTRKGVYSRIGCKFKPYSELQFKINFDGNISNNIGWIHGFMDQKYIDNKKEVVQKINDFISYMRANN